MQETTYTNRINKDNQPTPPQNMTHKKSDAILAWNRSKQIHALTLHIAILGSIIAILAARVAYLLNN